MTGASAGAQAPPRVVIVMDREVEGCPSVQQIRASVAARLGYDLSSAGEALVLVRFSRTDTELHADLQLFDAEGTEVGSRQLSGRSGACRELADSVELAIALAIDPLVSARDPDAPPSDPGPGGDPTPPDERAPEPEPEPSPSPTDPVRSAEAPVKAEDDGPSERARLRVGLLGSLVLGGAPSVTGGAWITAGFELGWFVLDVSARFDAPVSEPTGDGEFTTSLTAFHLGLCGKTGWAGACVVGAAGPFRSSSEGFEGGRSVVTPWAAIGGRVFGEVPLTPNLRIAGRLDLLAVVAHTSVRVDDVEVWSTGPAVFVFGLGLDAVW